MRKKLSLQKLKKDIEIKREELNKMIIRKDVDKNDVLKFSEELDNLIDRYYKLELNKK